ncbi:hypothetical protein F4677DRAFT_156089 [Hypoxylon crocopeplum]|nr:hypothetical protein F4677DRAFT_156089 [Hypoxylon crocopeplum]
MCLVGSIEKFLQTPKSKSKKSTISIVPPNEKVILVAKRPRVPSHHSPFTTVPADHCLCEHCASKNTRHNMDPSTTQAPEATEGDIMNASKERLKLRLTKKPGVHWDTEPPNPQRRNANLPSVPGHPRPVIVHPEIYIYPNSAPHIVFPVVNYSAAERNRNPSAWPTCYLAISPQNAKPADFEAALSPKGSKLMSVARLLKTRMTAPISSFRDAQDLRKDSIQLEVWDVDVTKVKGQK